MGKSKQRPPFAIRMTILFTTTYYTPYVSGLTILAKRLAEALSKKHQVTILTTQYEKDLNIQESGIANQKHS